MSSCPARWRPGCDHEPHDDDGPPRPEPHGAILRSTSPAREGGPDLVTVCGLTTDDSGRGSYGSAAPRARPADNCDLAAVVDAVAWSRPRQSVFARSRLTNVLVHCDGANGKFLSDRGWHPTPPNDMAARLVPNVVSELRLDRISRTCLGRLRARLRGIARKLAALSYTGGWSRPMVH
jgi:hypothetical protein